MSSVHFPKLINSINFFPKVGQQCSFFSKVGQQYSFFFQIGQQCSFSKVDRNNEDKICFPTVYSKQSIMNIKKNELKYLKKVN